MVAHSHIAARFLEKEFDRPFERLGDGDHDVRADQRLREEDPEYVVEKEAAQEDAANLKRPEVNELDTSVRTACGPRVREDTGMSAKVSRQGLNEPWNAHVTARPIPRTLFAAKCSS